MGYYAGSIGGKTIGKDELEESKKAQIILATFAKMSEGTDIPTLDTLFLATPASDIEQVVGRIQRFEGAKKTLLVVDAYFDTKYNRSLRDKREEILKKLGFTKQLG